MAAPYNLTALQNKDTLVDVISASNDLAGGLLATFFVLSLGIILFLAFKGYDTKRAFAGSSFIVAVVSIFFRMMGYISDTWMFGSIIITAFAFIYLKWG